MSERVIVTGSSGFIGRAVKRALFESGYEPVGYDLPLSVTSKPDLEAALEGSFGVIHLAGLLGTDELFDKVDEALQVNILGTANVLECCRRFKLGYVGITMPPAFPSIYAATKIASQRLASAYHHSHGVPVCHIRAFNVFGPGQKYGVGHPQKLVPTAAVHLWHKQPAPVWGDGEQTVDLVWVEDVAKLLVLGLSHGDDAIIDGGTGQPFTVNAVVKMIAKTVGFKAKANYLPMRRGEVPTKIVATGEGWDRLGGWRPAFRLADLDATVLSYKDVPCES